VEGNKYTILLVFAPVFGVAPNVTYSNTLCLARLEDQLKSGAILAYLFPSTGLKLSLMEGNEAIGRAAVAAGCTFFAGYPITPATTIYNTMLSYCRRPAGSVSRARTKSPPSGSAWGHPWPAER
jgi:hypothetical protein